MHALRCIRLLSTNDIATNLELLGRNLDFNSIFRIHNHCFNSSFMRVLKLKKPIGIYKKFMQNRALMSIRAYFVQKNGDNNG